MDKSEIEKYAELIISMSTDYLLDKISEEHYKNILEIAVKNILNDDYNEKIQSR